MTPTPVQNYQHVQETAAEVWTINHSMGTYPSVDVYVDVDGVIQKIMPQAVTYVDALTCTVTFSTARSGIATVS